LIRSHKTLAFSHYKSHTWLLPVLRDVNCTAEICRVQTLTVHVGWMGYCP